MYQKELRARQKERPEAAWERQSGICSVFELTEDLK